MVRKLIFTTCLLLLVSSVVMAFAQEKGTGKAAVEGETKQALQNRQVTQKELDQWSAEKVELVGRMRSARSSVEWLQERKSAEEARVESLEGRISELRRRLEEADRLEGSMQDTLLIILSRVEQSVDRGLPFLPEERDNRLRQVRTELARPDFTAAEKLRRVLEVLQVEADYANNAEVYQGRIEVGGQELYADILRIGRMALFWQTPDLERVGTYDHSTSEWVELPGGEKRNIGRAIEMATRMRPVELIDLPLGKIGRVE
jgi:Protein of unknown function (DUF3450)